MYKDTVSLICFFFIFNFFIALGTSSSVRLNSDSDRQFVLQVSEQCFRTASLPDNTELGSVIEMDTLNQESMSFEMRIAPRPMVHRHQPELQMWLSGHQLVRCSFGARFQDHFER